MVSTLSSIVNRFWHDHFCIHNTKCRTDSKIEHKTGAPILEQTRLMNSLLVAQKGCLVQGTVGTKDWKRQCYWCSGSNFGKFHCVCFVLRVHNIQQMEIIKKCLCFVGFFTTLYLINMSHFCISQRLHEEPLKIWKHAVTRYTTQSNIINNNKKSSITHYHTVLKIWSKYFT